MKMSSANRACSQNCIRQKTQEDNKMRNSIYALSMIVVMLISVSAWADECDPKFKDVELYYCKIGRQNYKVGLNEDSAATCIEYKKLNVTGCQVEPLKGTKESAVIIPIANAKSEYHEFKFKLQCSPSITDGDVSRLGGLDAGSAGWSKWMMPEYFPTKTPGKYNDDRMAMFDKDMAKKGKKLLSDLMVAVYDTANQYSFKYDKQICQFFNAETSKVAFKFSWSTDFKPPVAETSAPEENSQQPNAEKSDEGGGLMNILKKPW